MPSAEAHTQLEYSYLHPQTNAPRETVIYESIEENLRTRTATQWNRLGNAHFVAIDNYVGEVPSLATRSERQYDASERLTFQLDLFYDLRGSVRSFRATSYDYYGGPILQRTDDYVLDQAGNITQRRTRHFDSNQILKVFDLIHYDAEISPESGQGTPLAGTAGDHWDELPFHTDLVYLRQVRDTYLTTRLLLEPHESKILQMNESAAQQHLESLLSQSPLSSSEANRFRHLNLYFQMTKDLVSLGQDEDATALIQRYADAIDVTTGTWQPWFVRFAAEENLTLPLPPLQVAFDSASLSPRQAGEVAQPFAISSAPTLSSTSKNCARTAPTTFRRSWKACGV